MLVWSASLEVCKFMDAIIFGNRKVRNEEDIGSRPGRNFDRQQEGNHAENQGGAAEDAGGGTRPGPGYGKARAGGDARGEDIGVGKIRRLRHRLQWGRID